MTATTPPPAPLTPEEIKEKDSKLLQALDMTAAVTEFKHRSLSHEAVASLCAQAGQRLARCLDEIERLNFKLREVTEELHCRDIEVQRLDEEMKHGGSVVWARTKRFEEWIADLESRLQRSNELIKKAEETTKFYAAEETWKKAYEINGGEITTLIELIGPRKAQALLSDIEKYRQQSREGGE